LVDDQPRGGDALLVLVTRQKIFLIKQITVMLSSAKEEESNFVRLYFNLPKVVLREVKRCH